MNFNEYQEKAKSTAIYDEKLKVIYPAIGLGGETGEVLEKVKKVLRDSNGIFSDEKKKELKKELGDVVWYVSAIATDLGFSFEEVAQENLDKLFSRKERNVLGGSGDNR